MKPQASNRFQIQGRIGRIEVMPTGHDFVAVWVADDTRFPGVRLTHPQPSQRKAMDEGRRWFEKVYPKVEGFSQDAPGFLVGYRRGFVVLLPGVEFDSKTKDVLWLRAGGRIENDERRGWARCQCERAHSWHGSRRKCNRLLAAARHGKRSRKDGWEFDHYPVRASEGGSGEPENGRVTCWECHAAAAAGE